MKAAIQGPFTTLLPSLARTVLQTSADIPTGGARGIHVILDVTDVAAGPSITLTIKGKDPASGKYYTLLAGAAVVTAVTNVYKVFPGATASANAAANDTLPPVIQISIAVADNKSCTYSVGYNLLP